MKCTSACQSAHRLALSTALTLHPHLVAGVPHVSPCLVPCREQWPAPHLTFSIPPITPPVQEFPMFHRAVGNSLEVVLDEFLDAREVVQGVADEYAACESSGEEGVSLGGGEERR